MATEEVKKARITAVVFGVLSGLTLIAFVYAFFQQSEAERQAKEANQKAKLAEQLLNENTELKQHYERMAIALDKQNQELQIEYEGLRNVLKEANERLQKCKCK